MLGHRGDGSTISHVRIGGARSGGAPFISLSKGRTSQAALQKLPATGLRSKAHPLAKPCGVRASKGSPPTSYRRLAVTPLVSRTQAFLAEMLCMKRHSSRTSNWDSE
jgi:hypothetical protein